MPTVPKYWDSFETYAALTDLDSKLTLTGTALLEAVRARSGDRSLCLVGAANLAGGAELATALPSSAHVVLNFHVHVGGHNTALDRAVVDFRIGTTLKARIAIRDTRVQLRVPNTVVETSATPPPSGSQYWEVIYYSHASSGYFVLYIDGAEFVRFDGNTEGASGGADNLIIRSGQASASTVTDLRWNFDDLVVAVVEGGDIGGGVGDVRLGAVNHSIIVPTGDVSTAGTPSTGSDNFAMVDELPSDGDATHVEFAAVADKDLYSHGSSLPADTVPIGVKVTSIQRLPSGGTTQVRHLLDNTSSEVQGSDNAVGEPYAARSHAWSQSPFTSGAWSKAEVEALRFGVEARA